MNPATLLAVRPMHPPAFETIPELAPVLEYASGGANTTNNYRSPLSSLSSFSPARNSSTFALHLQNDVDEDTRVEKRSSLSSAGPAPSLARSQPPQLPPLNTGLPLSAYPMYPGLQTSRGTAAMASTSTATTATTTTSVPSTTTTVMTTTTTAAGRRGQTPRPLNRPRKISTSHARDSSFVPTRTSSSSYETPPSPQHYTAPYQSPTTAGSPTTSLIPRPRQRPAPTSPNELFGTLPGEVLDVILEWLQALHLDPPSPSSSSGGGPRSCATCWARDLCSLSLASRRWSAPARAALYRDVQLVGPDSAAHRKRFRLAQGCRMTLLRRTLRANPGLAATVRSLRVPAPTGETCDDKPAAAGGMSPREAYESRVAALVMACPNLEVLAGPAVAAYEHGRFDRITHALSTRTKLKTMNWRIGPTTTTTGGRSPSKPDPSSSRRGGGNGVFASALAAMLPPAPPPPLDAAQETAFLGCHRAWTSLTSLSVHCLPGAPLAPATLLQRALTCLPGLRHLHLCGLPADAFSDAALLALPELRSLTLSHVPGVSSRGLSAFATRPNSRGLRVLRLRHAPLTSLPALARLLSHLPRLEDLAVVQDFAPLMPSEDADGGGAFALWMMPYLASRTLVRLHWDVAAGTGEVSDADDILARSVEAGGFPALRALRAPSDPGGIFQQLCRPLEVVATSADRIWANGGRCGSSHGRSASVSSGGGSGSGGFFGHHPSKLPKSATAPSLPSSSSDPFGAAAPHEPHATDLRAARIAAQARLDDARPRHRFRVQVHSQEGLLVDDFGLAGYVGTVGSPIRYCLSPDPGATDARGGLVDVSHLTSPGGELPSCDGDDEAGGGVAAAGCTGSWNWREGVVVADRKEKETWWHTERGRWVRPRLD
ncbi:hypothetical protein ISF_00743 [Cordyceps fumosorosea ARSEF 2679]|uniref:F-box domain-containing protein n=1 Tax=Cordyceps fumosorosea (strain ARSEF 2679) TaxID=1081104 RepID=A0A162JU49_CORFA|nr:hypothetical protein ISF_00743 [Cordyceps fumosorosea ARSEF 2679]OAA73842.1 hypothetical protein ISF_00743 [Cordyceps fumosorosea ARSEF 2679]